jgi:hypothetical protein
LTGLIALEVALERVDHNHGHDAREEEDDGERVQDRKPVHLRIIRSFQVGVPPIKKKKLAF